MKILLLQANSNKWLFGDGDQALLFEPDPDIRELESVVSPASQSDNLWNQSNPGLVMQYESTAETNALAIVSLVFGILGWSLMPIIGSFVAIVCGHIARGQIYQSGGAQQGDGMALAGLILGYLSLALLLVIGILIFVFVGIAIAFA